jgi:hypothetical protein
MMRPNLAAFLRAPLDYIQPMHSLFRGLIAPLSALTIWILTMTAAHAADSLTWNTNDNRVSADIGSAPLLRVLEGISQLTGWHVFVESNASLTVSAKFNDLPSGQALRHLLGNLNFALVPQTNARSRFYVFHSQQRNATQLVKPSNLNDETRPSDGRIANELVLTLKRGASIQNLTCLENARIVGRIDGLNTYRVRFDDEASAKLGRECLAKNADVESIDSNFTVDRPQPAQPLDANFASELNLRAKESNGDCKVIIGLIDTPVGSLGPELNQFLLPSISVIEGNPAAQSNNGLSHGPAMAETILRGMQSTASGSSGVRILPVDVYGGQLTTTTFDVTQGIYRAVTSGANVINLSLGSSGDSTALHNLIRQAAGQGVIFFSAAGNQPVTTPMYPAAYPEVIAVTAGGHNGEIANYANRGNFVDIMTPGTSVIPYNGQSYVVNGTSAATAYASGIAAGLADGSSKCPETVVSTIRNRFGVQFGE